MNSPSVLPSELQSLLRYALQAPALPSFLEAPMQSSANESSSREGNERFRKLIDGIHFSKRFILSYQLVLIALLLVFTVIHWTSKLQAWRRRRRRGIVAKERLSPRGEREASGGKGGVIIESRSSGSSSSSSTLRGDATPEDAISEEPDERTFLLQKPSIDQGATHLSLFSSRIKAWLIYQPRPIPIINKTLPSIGASLVVIAFIGLQLFYTLFRTPLSLSMLFVFADRTSLLFVANLPLLYLFAAKNQPIKILTGYSYESLNIFHRRLGEVMCLLALLHSLGMVGVWYTILRPGGVTLVKFLLIKMILLGIGALVTYELIYFTSFGSFRQRWYELFLGLHVVLQAAALILVWFHHHGSRPYVGVALGIFLIDRLICRMSIKGTTVPASLEVMGDKKTVALSSSIPINQQRSLISYLCGTSNITSGWKTTEHVFLTVPSLAHKHIIQAHPFTIASPAPSPGDKEANLKLLIRAQDGFSADLLRYAHTHSTVTIRLDGPYGSQSAVNMLQSSDNAILVAGGSGIAVTWPLVWSILEAFTINDLERSSKITNSKKIFFVWVIREHSHLSWLNHTKLKELEARGVVIIIPPPTAEYGHPDIPGLMSDCTASMEGRIGVVASGPDGLNRCVRNTCAELARRGKDVDVEVEKFGW